MCSDEEKLHPPASLGFWSFQINMVPLVPVTESLIDSLEGMEAPQSIKISAPLT